MAHASTVTARLASLRNDIKDTDFNAWQTPPISYGAGVSPTNDKELTRAARALGYTVRKRDGEYRVAPVLGNASTPAARERSEATAYYTNDRADAWHTTRMMAIEREHLALVDRRTRELVAILEDMPTDRLVAFGALSPLRVPFVDVAHLVKMERARRASRLARACVANAGIVAEARAARAAYRVVLTYVDGTTRTGDVEGLAFTDAQAWEVAAVWVREGFADPRRARPAFATVACVLGRRCAVYEVAPDRTLSPVASSVIGEGR